LHAACSQSTEEACFDYVVSSYAPTLSAIIRARHDPSPVVVDAVNIRALLVAERNAPGMPILDAAEEEVRRAAAVLNSARATVTVLNEEDARPRLDTVLKHVEDTHILHLSCHGEQDTADALQSRFVLRDHPLTIAKLTKLSLPKAQLAVLTACETAQGAAAQPDQASFLVVAQFEIN
jgi:CHAT domain-containing protein